MTIRRHNANPDGMCLACDEFALQEDALVRTRELLRQLWATVRDEYQQREHDAWVAGYQDGIDDAIDDIDAEPVVPQYREVVDVVNEL